MFAKGKPEKEGDGAEAEGGAEDDKNKSLIQRLTVALQTPLSIELPFGLTFKGIFVYLGGIVSGVILSIVIVFSLDDFEVATGSVGRGVTLYNSALSTLERGYVDEVDVESLTETALQAMMQTLDPYTEFENEAQNQDLQEMVKGRYGGVGLVIAGQTAAGREAMAASGDDQDPAKVARAERVTVVDAFEGYAFDAGLRVGDRLLRVGGQDVRGKTVEQVKDLLRGPPGTSVAVEFERAGRREPAEVVLPRRQVRVPDVKCFTLLDPKVVGAPDFPVGYISLKGFSAGAGREVELAYRVLTERAQAAGASRLRGVVLDLRGNPGGLLDSAVDVASLLVPRDSTLVSVKGRNFPETGFVSTGDPVRPLSQPLVVLVDGGTASAAEIVSGAVQDLDAGVVVGTGRTFGKGLVQNVAALPFDAGLKYTTARYYTPSGRCIQAVNYEEGKAGGARGDAAAALPAEGGAVGNGNGNGNAPVTFTARQVQDADRQEFRTRAGRVIRDGGGVEPDVVVPGQAVGPLEAALQRNGVFFDFADRFAAERKALPDDLEVATPQLWREFKAYVREEERGGRLRVEDIYGPELRNLEGALAASGYKEADAEVLKVRRLIADAMLEDLDKFEGPLRRRLTEAVLARYLPDSMLIKASLAGDPLLAKAVELVRYKSRYTQLLAPPLSAEERLLVDRLDAQLRGALGGGLAAPAAPAPPAAQ